MHDSLRELVADDDDALVKRRLVRLRGRRALTLSLAGALAACSAPREDVGSIAAPIISGSPAPEYTGVVHVRHPLSPVLCSGTVIAPTLVVTTKHCVVREVEAGDDVALSAEGFGIGFGPDVEQLSVQGASAVSWIGAPEALEVEPAREAGEDVAVITLAEPVPSGTHIHPLRLDYVPGSGDQYALVGYGLSSIEAWDSGTKRVTLDTAAAFDPATALLQANGHGACNGDSGGPFLFGPDQELVAVIGEAGGSSDTSFCDIGATFGPSVANPDVRDLFSTALAALPACEEREEVCDNGQDETCDGVADEGCSGAGGAAGEGGSAGAAGTVSTPGGQSPDLVEGAAGEPSAAGTGEAGTGEAGSGSTAARSSSGDGAATEDDLSGCSCSAAARGRVPSPWAAAAAALLSLPRRRRRSRRP